MLLALPSLLKAVAKGASKKDMLVAGCCWHLHPPASGNNAAWSRLSEQSRHFNVFTVNILLLCKPLDRSGRKATARLQRSQLGKDSLAPCPIWDAAWLSGADLSNAPVKRRPSMQFGLW